MYSKVITIADSGAVSIGVLLANWIGTYRLCGAAQYGDCMDTASNIIITFVPFLPVLLIALVAMGVSNEIFGKWIRFLIWWIPVSMLLIFISPEYSHDLMLPIEKGTVAVSMSVLFTLVSIVIFLMGYFKTAKK
jgi:hypothetical protein